jgi:hypothetical protein
MTLMFPNEADLLGQGFEFRSAWWTPRMPAEWGGFLGRLPATQRDYRRISRFDLLAAASQGLPQALVASYVWGTGGSAFLVGRRARVFRDNDDGRIAECLTRSAEELASGNTIDAYESMLKGRSNYLKYLGPSFFTKFLYSADARKHRPGRALILDQFVARALICRHGWDISTTGPWPSLVYEKWIDHAHKVAITEGVRADAVELAYFNYGKEGLSERR